MEKELDERIKLVAEIFGFRYYQFTVEVEGNSALKNSLMTHTPEFYKQTLDKLQNMSELERLFAKARLQNTILGIPEKQVQEMVDRMEDKYAR